MKSLPYAASIVRTVAGKVIYVADSLLWLAVRRTGRRVISAAR
jgi:hypothetical protein